jgi:2-polyprenyl-3-methyl-5-hydroxy-6-metoxy-1,4-benzoquinol methylase
MRKKTARIHAEVLWSDVTFKQKLLISITRQTSGYFWFFADSLSCKLDGLAALYERLIRNGYLREYAVAGISPGHRVLHIGSGSYPLTDIILAQKGVHQVVGIDNDVRTVALAKAVVDKKNLRHQIVIEHADGVGYPVQKFDVIIVSSCSWPSTAILQHVFTSAKKRCMILVRTLDVAVEPVIRCIQSRKDIILLERMYQRSFPFYAPFGWQTFVLQKT